MNENANDDEPDPRARSAVSEGRISVTGVRCVACGFPTAGDVPRCPVCGSDVAPADFGSEGEIFASTILRVRIPGQTPPYGLAYLILDDGPRVLVHTGIEAPLAVGSRAHIDSYTSEGDLHVTPIDAGVAR